MFQTSEIMQAGHLPWGLGSRAPSVLQSMERKQHYLTANDGLVVWGCNYLGYSARLEAEIRKPGRT